MKVRPARASWMARRRSLIIRGFKTYPAAPVARHAWTKSPSECTVKKMTFEELPDSLNRLLASMPLRMGMVISVTITSGLRRVAASNRDWPSDTVPTTSHAGTKRLSTMCRNGRWSSANRIRNFPNWSAYRVCGPPKCLLRCFVGGLRYVCFTHAADPSMLGA